MDGSNDDFGQDPDPTVQYKAESDRFSFFPSIKQSSEASATRFIRHAPILCVSWLLQNKLWLFLRFTKTGNL